MNLKIVLSLSLALFLSACSSSGKSIKTAQLTPMPLPVTEPSDSQLMAFVKSYVEEQQGPANSRFDYTRVDLNGDRRRDALILFKGPHTYWCGWTGCMMIVLKAENETFSLLSELTSVRGPLIVSNLTTNGWKDLVIRVSGTNLPDRNVVMKFDGRSYPSNPAGQTTITARLSNIPGTRIFP